MQVMKLSEHQQAFARDIAMLILLAEKKGYRVTFGDAFRDPRVHGEYGVKKDGSYATANSEHKRRLAVDLNLFRDGEYLGNTDDHAELGAIWEALDEHNEWGGRWEDGNHYQRNA
jgi:hypothetical protein